MKKLDLTGQTFGKWTVLREDLDRPKGTPVRLICRCECGNEKSVTFRDLRDGRSKSCGCHPKITLTFAHKTASLKEWSGITGIPYSTLARRYKEGWPVEHILLMAVAPIGKKSKRQTARETP